MKPFRFINDKDITSYDVLMRKYPYKRGTSLQCHISDIHFGVMDAQLEYKILKEQYIDRIKDLPLDIISIDGDLFNKLDMSNTDSCLYASLLVADIVSICKNNRKMGIPTVFIILAGTKNHDAGQLRLFYHYLNDPDLDIRIVEQIQFEYVNGMKILCIPELYGIAENIYQQFLYGMGPYDMCFMHGTVQGAVYGDNAGESRLFRPEDFGLCMGPVIAGHVHPGGCFNSFMYYNGSPIRWSFGEEGPKGFQIVLYDMDSRKYYIYLEQIASFRYDTITIDELLCTDPKKVIEYIDNLKDKENIDYIRLKCKLTPDLEPNMKIIQEYYRTNKTVKFKIDKVMTDEEKSIAEKNTDLYNKYNYVFDKSMSAYDILARYIMDNEDGIFITGEDIKKLVLDE